MSSCCPPARPGAGPAVRAPVAVGNTRLDGMIELPGGTFRMGTDDPDGFPEDREGPVREVAVAPFVIGAHCVPNERFAEFVDATGYRTDAERFGWSYVFAKFLARDLRKASPRLEQAPWWCGVSGAFWRRPEGPGSDLDGR